MRGQGSSIQQFCLVGQHMRYRVVPKDPDQVVKQSLLVLPLLPVALPFMVSFHPMACTVFLDVLSHIQCHILPSHMSDIELLGNNTISRAV